MDDEWITAPEIIQMLITAGRVQPGDWVKIRPAAKWDTGGDAFFYDKAVQLLDYGVVNRTDVSLREPPQTRRWRASCSGRSMTVVPENIGAWRPNVEA